MLPVVALTGIRKAFAATLALDDVSLALAPGVVHGVLGENGAGKSTLMHILFGLIQPDAGRIQVDGRPVVLASPAVARGLGIGLVHQHFCLSPSLTVLENLALAVGEGFGLVRRRDLLAQVAPAAAALGWEMPWDAPAGSLSVGGQQRLEILKALAGGGKVLILDEPTAVLAPQEAAELLRALRRLAATGMAVVFISHKLAEIESVCDEVTILRRGRLVHHGPLADLDRARLATLMVGPAAHPAIPPDPRPAGAQADIRLRFTGVSLTCEGQRLSDASFTVRAGEIVGVAGVDGNGQGALVDAALGLAAPTSGTVARSGNLGDRALAVIPGDRRREGLVTALSVRDNLLLKDRRRRPYARWGWLAPALWRRKAVRLIRRFDVRPADAGLPVAALSGGNQQKVVVARELDPRPRLVVAVNPTRGLDLAASAAVMDRLRAARAAGAGVLLVHSDLDELLEISDRILVCAAGRVSDSGWPATTRERIGRLMLDAASAIPTAVRPATVRPAAKPGDGAP